MRFKGGPTSGITLNGWTIGGITTRVKYWREDIDGEKPYKLQIQFVREKQNDKSYLQKPKITILPYEKKQYNQPFPKTLFDIQLRVDCKFILNLHHHKRNRVDFAIPAWIKPFNQKNAHRQTDTLVFDSRNVPGLSQLALEVSTH